MTQELPKTQGQGTPEKSSVAPQTRNEKIGSRRDVTIEKLQGKYDECEKEKVLLADMSGECVSGKKIPPEIAAKYVVKFNELKRFQPPGKTSESYVESLVRENELGEPSFAEQIDTLTDYQEQHLADIVGAKEEAERALDNLYRAS